MLIQHFGKIKDGRLKVYNKNNFDKWLQSIKGKEIEIVIQNVNEKRTKNQNSFYWVWMTILGSHFGYSKREMDNALRFEFIGEKDPETGLMRMKSSKELSKEEFKNYLDFVAKFAAENQIVLPDPKTN